MLLGMFERVIGIIIAQCIALAVAAAGVRWSAPENQWMWEALFWFTLYICFGTVLVFVIFRLAKWVGQRLDVGSQIIIAGLIGLALSALTIVGGFVVKQRAVPTSSPEGMASKGSIFGESQAEVGRRHWSKNDKDRIAEALFDLKTIMSKDIAALTKEGDRIWAKWNQLAILNPATHRNADMSLDFDSALTEMQAYRNSANELRQRFYEEFQNKHSAYWFELIQPLFLEKVAPLARAPEEAAKVEADWRDLAVIYEKAPGTREQIGRQAFTALRKFAEINVTLGKWAQSTFNKAEQAEAAILK